MAEARSTTFVTSFLVAPDDKSPVLVPNPFAGDDRLLGARVDAGRFTDPAAPDEFTVNRIFATYLADHFGTKIGDQFQVTSFDQDQLATNRAFNSGEPPAVPLFTATLVGVTESPSAFDDPTPDMVFSKSFLKAHPTVGVVQTTIAVHLEPGADPDAVMRAVHDLPGGGDAFNSSYRIVSADARRAVRFQVTALWLVTAIAAIAAVFVVTQLVGRSVKTTDADGLSLAAIGWRSRDLTIERAIESCALAAIAVPVASIIGLAVTSVFPLGLLRTFEPHTGRRMDWAMTLLGLVAIVAVVVAAAAIRRRRFGRVNRPRRMEPFAGLIAASGAGVALAAGAHLTTSRPTGGRRSLGSLVPGAIGLAGVVAAGIVGLSLTNIVDRPARWGVNYDQLVGNPFVPAEDDLVAPVVDDPDVAELSAANIGSLTINGRDTGTLAFEVEKGDLVPTTLRGRPPANAGEIGLGAEVLRRLHVDVGDNVHAVGPTGIARDVRVVGTVVTPEQRGKWCSDDVRRLFDAQPDRDEKRAADKSPRRRFRGRRRQIAGRQLHSARCGRHADQRARLATCDRCAVRSRDPAERISRDRVYLSVDDVGARLAGVIWRCSGRWGPTAGSCGRSSTGTPASSPGWWCWWAFRQV